MRLRKSALCSLAIVAITALFGMSPAWAGPASSTQASRLSAEWWNWAAGQPEETSPLAGGACANGQSGSIWNLAGAPSTDPITRSCTLPVGKRIVLPVINAECSRVEGNGSTESVLRQCATELVADFSGSATLDGRFLPITQLTSRLFPLRYVSGNVFGIGGGSSGTTPSVASGYWVVIQPLPPGRHVLHVSGVVNGGPFAGFSQDVTYRLTVLDHHRYAAAH